MIPYGKQCILDEDIQAVVEVLKSPLLTQGPRVTAFEKSLSDVTEANYCQAVNSGTAALHIAYRALGISSGDRVLVPAISFAATANAVLYCGGRPEFVDIDPLTLCMDLGALEEKLKAQPKGYYKGVCVVHFAGYPVDMERVQVLANEYGLVVAEDACHALGAVRADSLGQSYKVGSCTYSDAAAFSFHPVKHVACGEGGAVTTKSEDIYKSAKLFHTHGITKETARALEPWEYDMLELGFNYRMPDILAALGESQLKRIEGNLVARRTIAKRYAENLDTSIFKLPPMGDNSTQHAYHLFVVQVEKRKELYNYLRENDISPQIHYLPIYKLEYYQKHFPNIICKNAEAYYKGCLSLPMFHSLSEKDQNYVIQVLNNFKGSL